MEKGYTMRSKWFTFLISCSFLMRVLGEDPDARPDLDKPIPLAKAVEEFNQKYPDKNPLMEAEVVAAVRAIKVAHPNIPDEFYRLYQKVAAERILPPGFYFSRITRWTTDEWHYEVDWKDLTFRALPQQFPPEKKLIGFNYRIRARFISSKPRPANEMDPVEKRTGLLQPSDLMKVRLDLEELRKKFLPRIPVEPQGDFWHPDELQRLREENDPTQLS